MKLNKWTLGLAAVGVVSLASVAQAEEKTAMQTALSSTTISGYVDTSIQWNPGTGTGLSYYKFGANKDDGFNLNVVQLSISKPLDESEWAAGYKVDMWMGPDANTLNTASSGVDDSDFAIRQAYVALRTPIGNGLDWKIGVFDTIIGYESLESGNNPNFTRSYGHSIEPQTHTGLLGTYRFCDTFSASFGMANTVGPAINDKAHYSDPGKAESYKTYMGSLALTAPQDWGWLAGSTLYAGLVNGFGTGSLNTVPGGGNQAGNQTSWYVGTTLATPVTGLKLGAAWDLLDVHSDSLNTAAGASIGDAWAASLYASYQATEKLSLHGRGELLTLNQGGTGTAENTQIWALTGTIQYDLWQNVISRLEARWDFGDEGQYFTATTDTGGDDRRNSYMLALNIIYKF